MSRSLKHSEEVNEWDHMRPIPLHHHRLTSRLFLELSRLQSDNREAASYNDIPAGDSSSDPVAKGSEGEGTDESASD